MTPSPRQLADRAATGRLRGPVDQPDPVAELVLHDLLGDACDAVSTHPHGLDGVEVDLAGGAGACPVVRAYRLRAGLSGDVDTEVRHLVGASPKR